MPQGLDDLQIAAGPALMIPMTASDPLPLTRRRDPKRKDCWLIYAADIHVGTIARSIGNPNAEPKWQCGFYPGKSASQQSTRP